MALVPFTYANPFHDALRDEQRLFFIADRRVVISQGWKDDGKGGTAIGFGASVYDAAICLSLYLDAHPDLVHGKRVIELGCGPGLVGIAAGCVGAAHVCITDGDPASVALTQRNVEQNDLTEDQCSVREYLWGTNTAAVDDAAPYDVILGADIIACPYADAFDALLKSFVALSNANTRLLLAYKRRSGSEQRFFAKFRSKFVIEQIDASNLHADFQHGEITLFEARLKMPSNT
ncbi:TPA: hypothetical protein N0F65_010022 [Lagenidium giganteum]|uniref:Uncharacterized protein n=1 Tax=Lagenidium giganteum TaxID=4803 RepID=A0AAV2ZDT8_9STRA|nr:TPA: hypothetical protein N0F65_010022 [Lagenidium giganteum]